MMLKIGELDCEDDMITPDSGQFIMVGIDTGFKSLPLATKNLLYIVLYA
jgi:hypothetical protein